MPLEIVHSTERSRAGWERTHQILLLEVLMLVVSVQICSEAETKIASLDLASVLLSVHGADVLAAHISMCVGY